MTSVEYTILIVAVLVLLAIYKICDTWLKCTGWKHAPESTWVAARSREGHVEETHGQGS